MKAKICGLTMREDVAAAVELGYDCLGFILAPSPRRVSLPQARALLEDRPQIPTVAVVVDPAPSELEAIVSSGLFDYVQFHGSEGPETVASVPLSIKAFGIGGPEDLERALSFQAADLILLDGPRGGGGRRFDWSMLKGLRIDRPWMLAGGLGLDNLEEGMSLGPDWVDLNSGLEVSPGVKDRAKMATAMEMVEGFNRRKELRHD